MTVNFDSIAEAILALEVSPLAKTEGTALVEAWIERHAATDSTEFRVLATECGWSVRLDDKTWAIGVMDLIASDERGIFGGEWKSTKAPSRYWDEQKWLSSILTGPQIAMYAMALDSGEFYAQGGRFSFDNVRKELPVRIRVRAAVKTASPEFWPTDPVQGWQSFSGEHLDRIADGLLNKAAQIRAARLARRPAQLMGKHCEEWGRRCQFWNQCLTGCETLSSTFFDRNDPAAKLALPYLPSIVQADDPEVVVLSASSYQNYSRCMEYGLRIAGSAAKEENLALQVGTVLHAGLAAFYQQMKEQQLTESQKGGSIEK